MPDSESHTPDESQAVLVADADRENASHLERQLRRAGVKNPIKSFENGDDLHAYLTEAVVRSQPMPCVLFLDPRMPGANGYDPIRWVRREKSLAGVKVVVFSNTNHPEEIESAGELGVHLFLKKHPDLSSLSTIVDHLCGVQTPTPSSEPAAPTGVPHK